MRKTDTDREVNQLIAGIAKDILEKRNRIILGKAILTRRDEIIAEKRRKDMFEISPETVAFVQKNHVAKADPLPIGDPVAEIHKSNVSTTLAPDHYATLMKRVAQANAAEIAKIKGGDVPHVDHAQPDDDGDDDYGKRKAAKCAGLIKEFMDKGDSFDVAATKAHHLEALKGQGQHHGDNQQHRLSTRTEDNLNGEPRQLSTQADRLNPKAVSP
jgi:hypothetical protein